MVLSAMEVKHQRCVEKVHLYSSTGMTKSVCPFANLKALSNSNGDVFRIKSHPIACPYNIAYTSCRCRMGRDRCVRLDE